MSSKLIPAIRQYCHNNGTGLTTVYDKAIVDNHVAELEAEIARLKSLAPVIFDELIDDEMLGDLRRCSIISCKLGFKLSSIVNIEMILDGDSND